MNQFNFPTTILSGVGALKEFAVRLKTKNHKKLLIVTDQGVTKAGLVQKLTDLLWASRLNYEIFADVNPNPNDMDVENGVEVFKSSGCDSLIGFGGGSSIDTAKVIKIMATHNPPLSQYDDEKGGDQLITNPMPPLYAIPTTSGTGSEVGRSGVIVLRETGKKTIFFHPNLMPKMAVLDPEMTVGLPKHITAATGIDAFSHCLEAFFSTGFHPMADGIALKGMELILDFLPKAYENGSDIKARSMMQMAAAMGATAFQKGLGMVHSLAHPLSSQYKMHHGLANALTLPYAIDFLEKSSLNNDQRIAIETVQHLFSNRKIEGETLSESCMLFFKSLGIELGLTNHQVPQKGLEKLSEEAFQDTCHQFNMIKVTRDILLDVYIAAFS
jgi:4-hydroxybutyrate dehydrogenase